MSTSRRTHLPPAISLPPRRPWCGGRDPAWFERLRDRIYVGRPGEDGWSLQSLEPAGVRLVELRAGPPGPPAPIETSLRLARAMIADAFSARRVRPALSEAFAFEHLDPLPAAGFTVEAEHVAAWALYYVVVRSPRHD